MRRCAGVWRVGRRERRKCRNVRVSGAKAEQLHRALGRKIAKCWKSGVNSANFFAQCFFFLRTSSFCNATSSLGSELSFPAQPVRKQRFQVNVCSGCIKRCTELMRKLSVLSGTHECFKLPRFQRSLTAWMTITRLLNQGKFHTWLAREVTPAPFTRENALVAAATLRAERAVMTPASHVVGGCE